MTSQPIRAGIAAATVAGLLAIAGCGSDDDTATAAKATSSPAPTATPTAAAEAAPAAAPAPESLRGRWRRTMRAADFGSAAAFPLGVWKIDVRRRAVDVYAPRRRGVDFTMQLTVDGRRLTVGTAPVCSSTGTYTWRATGRRLTMAPVEDTCSPRESLFGGTWTRMR